MNRINLPKNQNGAALVVGLILMVVVTILAISGMNTATTELAMARNDQAYENAFQAAETGLETAISQGRFDTAIAVTLPQNVNSYDSVTAIINFETRTYVPDRAFSLGVGSGISAYHFLATSTAASSPSGVGGPVTDRDASATHTQAFYKVGPPPSTLF